MKTETVEQLLNTLAESLNAAFAAHSKITALEMVLVQHDPSLHEAYLKALAEVTKNPPFVINPLAFSSLQSKLVQDQ